MQAILLPTDPILGYFAPKEVIYWALLFLFCYATDFDFKNPYFVPISVILTWLGLPLFYNPSLGSAWMVALLPFSPWWHWPLVILTMVAKGGGLTAWPMLLVVGVWRWGWAWVLPVAATMVGKCLSNPRLFLVKLAPHDRREMWCAAMSYWWHHANVWIGTGLGTFMLFGRKVQEVNHWPLEEIWFSLHNDWLQALFEVGLIGLGLAVWLLLSSLKRLRPAERLCLLSVAVAALGNFPMDCPLFQCLVAWLLLKGNVSCLHRNSRLLN